MLPSEFSYWNWGQHARINQLKIVTEKDGCSYVYHPVYGRGPKKHSRKAALLRFWERGFIQSCD